MTFTVAVATGPTARADLERSTRQPGGEHLAVLTHQDHAIAWRTDDSFVSQHDDGTVCVVVDGTLHDVGAPGSSPAEVFLERYRRVGEDVARDLLGDFVAIVLDRNRSALLVCRDPLGVRPWFQASRGRQHAGATAEAALRSLPWVDGAVDETIALAYLAFLSVSQGRTFHRGISTLQPGSTWIAGGGRPRTWRHHSWQIDPRPEISWEDAAELARELLDQAVASRLRGAGIPSVELSGGLDSSSVVGTMVLQGHEPLVGRLLFDGKSADERAYSQAVIDVWKLPAVSVDPWIPDAVEASALRRRLRRPLPDANFTMFASLHREFVRAGRPRGLTGLGGDDAFIAMPWETRVRSAVQQQDWHVLRPLLEETIRTPQQTWRNTWRPVLRYFAPRTHPQVPDYVNKRAASELGVSDMFARPPRLTGVSAIDYRAVNLTSGHTAFLLEARALITDLTKHRDSHPYLDPRLIEGLYGLNVQFPVEGGHYRGLQPAAYGDRLPPAIRDRRSKAEFSEVFWPGLLRDDAIGPALSGPLQDRGWLQLDGVDRIVQGARRGESWAAVPLNRIVEMDRWLRHHND